MAQILKLKVSSGDAVEQYLLALNRKSGNIIPI